MNDRTAAEKQRLYRRRRKLGVRIYQVPLNDADLINLTDEGFLSAWDEDDPERVVEALLELKASVIGNGATATGLVD